jgi:hypothetical protein
MSSRSFLGKTPPVVQDLSQLPSKKVIALFLPLLCASLVLGALLIDAKNYALLAVNDHATTLHAQEETSQKATKSTKTSTTAKKEAPGTSSGQVPCTFSPYAGQSGYLDAAVIFPLIPAQLRPNATGDGSCPPPAWNLNVVRYFIYKALTLLNWLAGALAVILTILAGLYYIAGFASESNIKKGKTILVTAYTGLIIVSLARLIVYGSVQLFTGQESYNPGTAPAHSTDFIQ